ncbi:DMT family transporter [Sunxiuqinia indica]|uniref:DMT family transporter n=1 Tax=Sunxiuqinia indica TaxID=2692584 RepID=UPI001357AA8C|nr:DMT family transporter [Sunxiuqinia indica]
MSDLLKNHIKLHFIVFILGFTAIIGKLISLPAVEMVWYRMLIAFVALGAFLFFRKQSVVYSSRAILQILGVGLIVAVHWITFFHAVKISNVSVTLGCMASTTLFTSILEPMITRRRFIWFEVIIGAIILIGLYLIFQFEFQHKWGIVTALISAFLAGLFTVLNKTFIPKYNPVVISFYEMGSGFIGITFLLIVTGGFSAGIPAPSAGDWMWLLVLGVVCTAYAYVVSIDVMKVLSAYSVVLTINMEPIYGILMAFFIFKDSEYMSLGFYIGTLIILAAVFSYPLIIKMLNKRSAIVKEIGHLQ